MKSIGTVRKMIENKNTNFTTSLYKSMMQPPCLNHKSELKKKVHICQKTRKSEIGLLFPHQNPLFIYLKPLLICPLFKISVRHCITLLQGALYDLGLRKMKERIIYSPRFMITTGFRIFIAKQGGY